MAERKNPFRNVQLVVRPGPRKLKILLFALVFTCAAALIALGVVRSRIRQQTQAALDQAAVLEEENKDLSEVKENLDTGTIKEIAKEELGLVDPDTVIIEPNS